MTDHDTDEAFVHAALSSLPGVEPSASLSRRVAQLPITHPIGHRSFWPLRTLWLPALGWALAAALGITTGMATLAPLEGETSSAALAPRDPALPGSAADASGSELVRDSDDTELDTMLVLAWGHDDSHWDDSLMDGTLTPQGVEP